MVVILLGGVKILIGGINGVRSRTNLLERSKMSRLNRGFKSRLNETQQRELLLVFSQSRWKNQPAKELLHVHYGITLPSRTLADYKRRLKSQWDRSAERSEADNTVDWADFAKLAEQGIPDRHLRDLHKLWQVIEKAYVALGVFAIKPTYRSLRWAAYILEYYGDVISEDVDLQFVAEQYAARETISEWFGDEIERDDLDKWLLYRPWVDNQQEAAYLQNIHDGVVPSLIPKYGWCSAILLIDSPGSFGGIAIPYGNLITLNKVIADSAKPYLLPSQIVKEDTENTSRSSVELYYRRQWRRRQSKQDSTDSG